MMIAPLIVMPYLSRVLGSGGIGVFAYAHSIAFYFVLLGSLGSSIYGQREIAYVQHDIDKRTIVFKEIVGLRIMFVLTAIIIYLTLIVSNSWFQEHKIVFMMLSIEIIASAIDVSWFFMGLQDFKRLLLRNIIVRLISIVCIFIFVNKETDVSLYALCYALPIFLGNISMWFYLPKYLSKTKAGKRIKHILPLLALLVPQIAVEVYTVLDKTMLGTILREMSFGLSEVGYYEQSQKIITVPVRLITAMGIVMLPRIAELFTARDNEKIETSIGSSFRLVFALGFPLMFGLIGVSNHFIPWFYGSKFELEKMCMLMISMSPLILLIGISNTIGTQFLLPTKQQKVYTLSVTIGALLNFCLNFILIRYLYAIGAVISSLAAEGLVTGIQMFIVRKQLPLLKFLKTAIPYFCFGLIMLGVVYGLGLLVKATVAGTLVLVFTGAAVYGLCLLLIHDPIILKIIMGIKTRIFKHKI
jgi:O-antigen/teichoic acid export membrane protein